MEGTKLEVKDFLLRYRDPDENNDKEIKTTKELNLTRAIIVLDEHGNEKEIMVPRNEIGKVSLPNRIEATSILYRESKSE